MRSFRLFIIFIFIILLLFLATRRIETKLVTVEFELTSISRDNTSVDVEVSVKKVWGSRSVPVETFIVRTNERAFLLSNSSNVITEGNEGFIQEGNRYIIKLKPTEKYVEIVPVTHGSKVIGSITVKPENENFGRSLVYSVFITGNLAGRYYLVKPKLFFNPTNITILKNETGVIELLVANVSKLKVKNASILIEVDGSVEIVTVSSSYSLNYSKGVMTNHKAVNIVNVYLTSSESFKDGELLKITIMGSSPGGHIFLSPLSVLYDEKGQLVSYDASDAGVRIEVES